MKIDGMYKVINHNKGNKTHYQRSTQFELYFDKLWDELVAEKLVKAKSFQFILNSNTYKYSPYIELNKEQDSALQHIMTVLDSRAQDPYSHEHQCRPILINGSAGTGKTVVATSLFHYLRNHDTYKNMSIALIEANVQMRDILQRVFKQVGDGLSESDVISPIELTKRRYNIVICDEVHALRRRENLVYYKTYFDEGNSRLGLDKTHDELDWILQQSDYPILFYDAKQCVKHSDIRDSYVQERIQKNHNRGFRPIELKSQMRIKAGRTYVPYIYDILHQKAKRKRTFQYYDFKMFSSFENMRTEIKAKETKYGLSKLCGGYAWKWVSKEDPSLFDIHIDRQKIRWNNSKIKNWVRHEASKEQMGSLYTLRGIDLNYAGVVVGPDLYFDKKDCQIKVNISSLYSKDVTRGATEDEIKEYVLNTYAILFTRAIEGTYVYVCDDALREYFKSFMDLNE